MKARVIHSAGALLCAYFCISCTQLAPTAGAGSETTNSFAFSFVYPDSTKAKSVRVRIRRSDYISLNGNESDFAIDTIANTQGDLYITNIPSGEFTAEALDDSGRAVVLHFQSPNENASDRPVKAMLRKQGSLSIHVRRVNIDSGIKARVYFYGLERSAQDYSSGTISLSGLAPATYRLYITSDRATLTGALDFSATVEDDAHTYTPQLSLPIDYRIDSLEVARYLSLHNFPAFDWDARVQTRENRIRKLDLSYLNIARIHESISNLDFLWTLDLRANPLNALPQALAEFPTLYHLRLDSIMLDTLPGVVCHCKNLFSLYLNYTTISELPQSIALLSELKILEMKGNAIARIPEEAFSLRSLNTLDVSENALDTVGSAIAKLTELKRFVIARNRLSALPQEIGQCKKLEVLIAFRNELEEIPASLMDVCSMRLISLQANNLRFLPDSIGNLNQLTHLLIDNNQLTTLPASIVKLHNLTNLKIGKNRLCDIDTTTRSWLEQYAEESWGSKQICQ